MYMYVLVWSESVEVFMVEIESTTEEEEEEEDQTLCVIYKYHVSKT
jgi:hypothetical protein